MSNMQGPDHRIWQARTVAKRALVRVDEQCINTEHHHHHHHHLWHDPVLQGEIHSHWSSTHPVIKLVYLSISSGCFSCIDPLLSYHLSLGLWYRRSVTTAKGITVSMATCSIATPSLCVGMKCIKKLWHCMYFMCLAWWGIWMGERSNAQGKAKHGCIAYECCV